MEQLVKFAERDNPQTHDGCGGSLERDTGLELPIVGKPAFQTQAVIGNGAHVKGHFGKDSARRK